LFADIAGFTAWSSTRDPAQVFTLLEEIYSNFDAIAKKRKIFKVETIGDCYVATSGLPEPRVDHAEAMCRFALECRSKMNVVVRRLEVVLGPDTSELAMRIGIHSGAVTAGVLRGEKGRFQLFGDTVNTTARIESTGERDRIHLSQATAELLVAAGKQDWIVERKGLVTAKGKGELQTYWLKLSKTKRRTSNATDTSDKSNSDGSTTLDEELVERQNELRRERLIKWNVDVLSRQLKRILAMRETGSGTNHPQSLKLKDSPYGHVIDEIKEVIPLSNEEKHFKINPDVVRLPPQVVDELTDYVRRIARMYHDDNRK
jgi:class 3 adenylate cyclase